MEGSRAYLLLGGSSGMYSVHPPCSRGMQLARGSCYQAQHIQRILWLLSPTQWLFLVLTTWLAGTRGTGGEAGKAGQHHDFFSGWQPALMQAVSLGGVPLIGATTQARVAEKILPQIRNHTLSFLPPPLNMGHLVLENKYSVHPELLLGQVK